MESGSRTSEEREKSLNLLRWVTLGGAIVVAVVILVLLSDIGIVIYALAAFLIAEGVFDFFVLFPWLIKRGKKST